MSIVAGVDGCRAGWFVVTLDLEDGGERTQCLTTFKEVVDVMRDARAVAIDIPIGFLDAAVPGGRDCDRKARALLGPWRGRSVFSPPVWAALAEATWEAALDQNRRSSVHRIGISRECFNLFAKMREVDALMAPDPRLQRTIKEAHPELAFQAMSGFPSGLIESKKSLPGRRRRLALLRAAGFTSVARSIGHRPPKVAVDDVLDAYAACWSARRIAEGRGRRLPVRPPSDARGLRMEIWY